MLPAMGSYRHPQKQDQTRRSTNQKEKEGCANELSNLFLPQRGLEMHYHGEFTCSVNTEISKTCCPRILETPSKAKKSSILKALTQADPVQVL